MPLRFGKMFKNTKYKNTNTTNNNNINRNRNRNNNQIQIKNEQILKVRGRWGTPCWIFFHTLAEHIKEEYYSSNYIEVIKIINRIIANIPCPLCKEHAINRMKKVKVSDLNTKDKLKIFFYEFHNEVNKRNGQQVENMSILDNYKLYNMKSVYLNFINIFFKSYYAGSGLGLSHIRNNNKREIKKYFNNNWNILFN